MLLAPARGKYKQDSQPGQVDSVRPRISSRFAASQDPAHSKAQTFKSSGEGEYMSKRASILMLSAALALPACSLDERGNDVSDQAEFQGMIGSQYVIIGAVSAYGIRKWSGAPIDYITLIPPPGIAGSEVGFTIPLVEGSKITVLKVIKTNRWPDPDMNLIVRVEGTPLPAEVPVRIALFRGNEGKRPMQLNPSIYRPRSAD